MLLPEELPDDDLLMPLRADGDGWLGLVQQAERPIGPRAIADYEILDEVRSGGQALVFRARHAKTGREVALKRLAHGAFASQAERRRFEREVEATSALQHPGIVTVYGTEQVAGVDLLVMEWVRGAPLDVWAATGAAGAAVGFRARLDMFLQVCDAVQYAHRHGVIHRDLKPSNVLVDEHGRCRVLDFGMARRITLDDSRTLETLTGGFAGTPAYAPPEASDAEATPPDVRGDVYSLGVILYELLAGERPFVGDSVRELLERIAELDPARLRAGPPARQRDLDAVVRTALQKSPDDRYATVHDFAADVRRYLAAMPVTALRPTAAYLARRWIGRHRTAFGAGCVLFVLAVTAIATFVVQREQIIDERDAARKARQVADDALLAATAARRDAQREADTARAVADFYLDIVRDAAPSSPQATVDFFDVLQRASADARERLAEAPAWVAEIEANMALWTSRRGQSREAIELARSALELQREAGTAVATTSSLLHRVIGESEAQLGNLEAAIPALRASVAELEGSDEFRKTRSVARYSLGRMLHRALQPEPAEQMLRAAIADADGEGFTDVSVTSRAGLAWVLLDTGRLDDAKETLDVAAAIVGESVSKGGRWTLATAQGDLHLAAGQPQQAIAPLQQAVEIGDQLFVAQHPERALSRFRLGRALRAAERFSDAEARLLAALELGLDGGELAIARETVGSLLAQRGEVAAAAEQYGLAWTEFDRLLVPSHGRRIVAFANWLAALLSAGEREQAREQLPRLLAQVRSCAVLGGTATPVYWQRVFAIAEQLGAAELARTELRAALAELQASESSGDPQIAAIAAVVEQL